MNILQIRISDSDFRRYNLTADMEIKFADLVEKINLEYARKALLEMP